MSWRAWRPAGESVNGEIAWRKGSARYGTVTDIAMPHWVNLIEDPEFLLNKCW